ncbi:MAG: cytochrome c3 family protein [bacterium]|nr:cytochrome c3 family protein [bacterium]
MSVLLAFYSSAAGANSLATAGRLHGPATELLASGVGTISSEPQRERCSICHTPRAQEPVDRAETGVLWNASATSEPNWQMYASDPALLEWIDGTIEPAPTGSSKVCLGCHDGVTAVNQSDGRSTGSDPPSVYSALDARPSVATGRTAAGFTNNHPISITYAWTRDSQLHNPAYAIMGDGRTVQSLLEGGRVECATCHDVHATDPHANRAMLRTGNAGADRSGGGASDLCLVCHDK